jgi:cytochrome d ubiquinol oxidase subunit I
MTGSALLLSRAQFAFTIGFHILWPAYTIGVSGFIVIVSILWLRTGQPVYRALMASGFTCLPSGSPWAWLPGSSCRIRSAPIGVFAERTANVIGPFFTYEVLTAFFLEAGFVGVTLFGVHRVSARLHFLMPCRSARCAHQRILDFGCQ